MVKSELENLKRIPETENSENEKMISDLKQELYETKKVRYLKKC